MSDIQDNGFQPTITFKDLEDIDSFECNNCGAKFKKKEVKECVENNHQFWYTDSSYFFCNESCATEYCNHKYGTDY